MCIRDSVNPSGKLPFTWPARLEDVGAHALGAYPGTWRADKKVIDQEYKEGIYVGYRWVDKAHTKPLFAFGHGLSYTSFALSNLRLDKTTMRASDSLRVTVTVRNTGPRDGKETVQLYVRDNQASVDRPMKELKGFAKVELRAGQRQDVTITIGKDALSFYDEKNKRWTAEPGEFTILVGNSSDKLKLRKSFVLL